MIYDCLKIHFHYSIKIFKLANFRIFAENNPSTTFTTNADPNPNNDTTVTLKAVWEEEVPIIPTTSCTATYNSTVTVNLSVNGTQDFSSQSIVCAILAKAGYYKLEVWGAQGGYGYSTTYYGGYGGYSVGIIKANRNASVYTVVGGQGTNAASMGISSGGYNGGGAGSGVGGANVSFDKYAGGGGGATHIATTGGLLKTLSSNRSAVLIVAGGGSGGFYYAYLSALQGPGHCGGGIQDCGGLATQDSGYAFGQGMIGEGVGGSTPGGVNGGGGGWYGGDRYSSFSSGGGSGYIASSNLISSSSITKHMTCYSCTTDSNAATLTYSNTTTPTSTPTADVARSGNGYARITYLGTSI